MSNDVDFSESTAAGGGEHHENEAEGNAAERELERKTLARKENQAVSYLRAIVLVVLLITAALVSAFIYLYVSQTQKDDFESEFESHAAKILETFHDSVERKIEAIDALSVQYTSYARATGASFPNVTLPDMEIR